MTVDVVNAKNTAEQKAEGMMNNHCDLCETDKNPDYIEKQGPLWVCMECNKKYPKNKESEHERQ